jgi:hypothetical protein
LTLVLSQMGDLSPHIDFRFSHASGVAQSLHGRQSVGFFDIVLTFLYATNTPTHCPRTLSTMSRMILPANISALSTASRVHVRA